MFRIAVLSIVLALATGTNAVLYCALSCHPVEETAGGCEHGTGPTTAPRNVAAADCAIAGNAIPFVREDDEWKIDKKGYVDRMMQDVEQNNQEMDDFINQGKATPQ